MPEKMNVEVIVAKPGKRGDGEGKADRSAPAPTTEVEGHYPINTWVICPHCGSHRNVDADTDFQQWYNCGNCGGSYYY